MVNSEKIKLVSEWFVRPDYVVEAAKQPYYLCPVDLAMISIHPIQKGLLFSFQNPTHTRPKPEIRTLVERLKRSLSSALVLFYPLAGRFETVKYEDDHACWIYLDCIKGPGARLIHARSLDLTVSDILSSVDVHPAVGSFFDLGERMVNYDGHTKPLLTVQVTELLDGVFIGFSMVHSVVDGTSFVHFVTTLSEIFKSDMEIQNPNTIQISRLPLYKMYIPEGYDPVLKLPYLDPDEFISRSDRPAVLRERIFHFSPESMARIKAKANEEGGTHFISSFMALSGLVWRSITRARNPSAHEKTSCFLLSNARTRLDPPLSDNYLGNFAKRVTVVCRAGELLGQSLGWASTCLSLEVKKNTPEVICESLKKLADCPVVRAPGLDQPEFYGSVNNVVIGGSPRFDMYGPEFGLGRALAVRMGYANKDNGKVCANPGREGGGSVDLEICLKPELMSALEADEGFTQFVSMV